MIFLFKQAAINCCLLGVLVVPFGARYKTVRYDTVGIAPLAGWLHTARWQFEGERRLFAPIGPLERLNLNGLVEGEGGRGEGDVLVSCMAVVV